MNNIKEEAALINIEYTGGRQYSMQQGTKDYNDIFNHCMRVSYLSAAIDEARDVDGVTYIGDTIVDLGQYYHKLWHYRGQFDIADGDKQADIIDDDGEGGSEETTTVVDDHYRAGSVAVGAGGAIITFMRNGVPSPLANANYQVDIRVVGYSGYEQRNVVPSTQFSSGFVVEDILEAGILHYTAHLDT